MSIGTGNTAASPVPPHSRDSIALGGHNVQFYSDDAFLLDDLSRHIGSALGAGEAGLVIATKSHRDGLAQRLTARGLDLNLAATLGRYVTLDAAETLSKFMVGGRPDAERFACVVGGVIARATAGRQGERVRVAAFGEMVALLWTDGQCDAALRLEQLWNDLSRIHSFDLRCAYPMRAFSQADDGELIGKVCSAHSGVIPAESYTSITTQEQRLRAVALLQQKAQALESEVGKRKKAQLSLELSKAALADLLENALEGVQQIGADQVVVWANTALLNLLGYSAEEYVGYPLGQFYVQQDVFEEYWLRLMSREDIYDFPAELRCKDGSAKHVLIHSNGLWVGGQFMHTRCFIRDITEHKRMEQSLREKNDAMREAVAIRDEFLSVAAHELKTPVTSLRGFAQLLLRDTRRKREISSERLESALNAIELHTGKLNQLMERLLNSAQIEAGKLRIELLKTDLVALIHAAIEQQQGDAQQRVIFDGPEQCEAVVDPVRFEQVITNLLDNALKYSPDGDIVTIGLRQGKDCGVELSVTDHGVGIPLDQRAHIFDRFYQAHGERHLSGMGLGLYITREIVYLHGGNLRIEEPEHTGTRFVVTLPSSTDGARPSLERKKVRI